MEHLEKLLARVPDACKDLRLNLTSVLRGNLLRPQQTWAVALTAAYFNRGPELVQALLADGKDVLTAVDVEDAQAAAALMRMNTVYYRTRHYLGQTYEQLRPSLRMNRMLNPATSKAQFELCALACAALAGCEVCLKAHEEALRKQDMTEAQIHDAVRIAAVVAGAIMALSVSDPVAAT